MKGRSCGGRVGVAENKGGLCNVERGYVVRDIHDPAVGQAAENGTLHRVHVEIAVAHIGGEGDDGHSGNCYF